MKKIVKFLLGILLFFFLIFGFYLYKLHALAVEGNKIFEERCLKVNPHLISYKKSFLECADFLKNPEKNPDFNFKGVFENYLAEMKNYVEEENRWLERQRKFLDRWDFKLIEPGYLKEAGEYQWKMYEAYRDDAQNILEVSNQVNISEELDARIEEAKARKAEFSILYFSLVKEASTFNDWRKRFGNVPFPAGCTKENMVIPETAGSLNWENELPLPSVSPDSDLVS